MGTSRSAHAVLAASSPLFQQNQFFSFVIFARVDHVAASLGSGFLHSAGHSALLPRQESLQETVDFCCCCFFESRSRLPVPEHRSLRMGRLRSRHPSHRRIPQKSRVSLRQGTSALFDDADGRFYLGLRLPLSSGYHLGERQQPLISSAKTNTTVNIFDTRSDIS